MKKWDLSLHILLSSEKAANGEAEILTQAQVIPKQELLNTMQCEYL